MDTIVAYFNQTKLFSDRNALAELQHHESVDSAARARHSQRRVPDRTLRARSRINAFFLPLYFTLLERSVPPRPGVTSEATGAAGSAEDESPDREPVGFTKTDIFNAARSFE